MKRTGLQLPSTAHSAINVLLKSELEEIKGIGKLTAQKLLKEFGSVEKIREAMKNDFGDFEKRAGKKAAERLKEWVEKGQ